MKIKFKWIKYILKMSKLKNLNDKDIIIWYYPWDGDIPLDNVIHISEMIDNNFPNNKVIHIPDVTNLDKTYKENAISILKTMISKLEEE